MKELKTAVRESIKSGWKMSKKISSGGLFSEPVYDNRTVYSFDDLFKLSRQGFSLNEDAGLIALNILITHI